MTDRFPIILDTSNGNQLKELALGDNLDLQGSSIVKAASIETVGNLSALSITVNGNSLAPVALSNDYTDLDNVPSLFSGSYQDLVNKPDIPGKTFNLEDVDEAAPINGDSLVFDSSIEKYVPKPVLKELDLGSKSIGDLGDTLLTGDLTNRYLKFTAGAWRASNVTWTDVKNKPTGVSAFNNDAGYLDRQSLESQEIRTDLIGSVFADDSTLIIDGVNGELPDYVRKQDLKDIVAASTDFDDFKTRIQDL